MSRIINGRNADIEVWDYINFMVMKRLLWIFIVPLWVCTSCIFSGKQSFSSEDISITWELKSNFAVDGKTCMMEFVLTNNGKKTLGNENWTLYFTQMNSPVVPNETNSPARVEFINGYFYRLAPNKNFSLAPGASQAITYYFEDNIGRETDAPCGLYFVFNENTSGQQIVPIRQYTVLPFVREEQLMYGPNDEEPIMTVARRYELNSHVTSVPADKLPVIIPAPVEVKYLPGELVLGSAVELVYQEGLKNEADFFTGFLRQQFGVNLSAKESTSLKGAANTITLKTGTVSVKGITNEAYYLDVTPDKGIVIEGSDASGVFYGIQSLIQLIPVELFKTGIRDNIRFAAVAIKDAPRFGYRGQHLDVARNFHNVKLMKKVIDIISFYKLNRMDIRLTDDEGWRLEIPDLPELTDIGSVRGHILDGDDYLQPAFGSGPYPNDPSIYGSGYFSRADFIELVKYAAQRHVEIIPEICYPSHARSAIISMENRYDKYMKQGDKTKANEYRLRDPDDKSKYLSAQLFTDNVACMGMESTYHFYDKVIGEIKKMYDEAGVPFKFFHTGGDELANGAWMESPLCKPFLDKLDGAKNTTNLNAICFNRMVEIVNKYVSLIGGWEEVGLRTNADGKKYPNPQFAGKNIVPYVWNNLFGDEDLGYRLANAGYPVVLCNVSNFYFDLAYDKDPLETGLTWGGLINTKDAFYFAPYDMFKTTVSTNRGKLYTDDDFKGKEKLKPEARKNIMGIQAQLWSETSTSPDRIEYYLLPKLLGFATSAWSPERPFEKIDNRQDRLKEFDSEWNIFANAVGQREMKRLDYLFGGYGYRIDPPGAVILDGKLHANNEFPGFEIRYTTDGSEPTRASSLYTGPVDMKGAVTLKAFNAVGRSSRTSVVQ